MKYADIVEAIRKTSDNKTDLAIGALIGVTGGRVSQLKSNSKHVSALQVARMIHRAVAKQRALALQEAIRPIVELYPIDAVPSKQEAKWELLPCVKGKNFRNCAIRSHLDCVRGVYFFYNSQGEILYTGKTEKQTLWKEMTQAFNRERTSHKAFMVAHPSTGTAFEPAWKKLRQPKKTVIYLSDVARFFSAYEVAPELIGHLEALVVRSICNDMSNVKMEKFKF